MSTAQRNGATKLAEQYARCYKVDLVTVVIELREDDDAEIWAPGVGAVWTMGCKPYQTTLDKAGVKKK